MSWEIGTKNGPQKKYKIQVNTTISMDTDNRVAPPITFVYCFCLQNLRRHMCCRAIKTKLNLKCHRTKCQAWTLLIASQAGIAIAKSTYTKSK